MYTRDEIKALTDKVLNMAQADAVEVEFTGGERSGTRWANSTITTNLIQFDQQVSVNLRFGNRTGSASTRELDDGRAAATRTSGSPARPTAASTQTAGIRRRAAATLT